MSTRRAAHGVDGVVVVDKPSGLTSHDVVARARRALGTRKVGHAGTLDPMATGILVLGAGRATRLLGHLALHDKEYRATVRLGARTVTDDAEGAELSTADATALGAVTDAGLAAAFAVQTGAIRQRPSAVSAIKVDGRRAHARVRAGEDVELPARDVHVARIDVLAVRRSAAGIDVDVDVECSTGTYVRAIARDVGEALGIGGHLTALRRTRVGPFTLAEACAIDDLDASALLPLGTVAARCFPTWAVTDAQADAVRHGRRIPWTGPAALGGPVAVIDADSDLLALATDDGGTARYAAVFAT